MATLDESYGFFNAEGEEGSYDRDYDADQFAQYFALFVGSGVFAYPLNQLQVTSKSGMTVTVRSGWAFIDGYWYHLKQNKDISIPLNQTGTTKTHSICCTLDKLNRKITVDLRQDVGAGTPRNNDTYHDLVLALISVSGSATQITNSLISDKRPDKSFCGYVTGLVDQIDATDMFQQFQAQFEEWFDDVVADFEDSPAGGLQSQINELKTSNNNKIDKSNIVTNYTTNDSTKVVAASVAYALKSLIDEKQATIKGAATSITGSNLTASRVLISDGNGKVAVSSIASSVLSYLSGLNINVQNVLGNETIRYRGDLANESALDGAKEAGIYGLQGIAISGVGIDPFYGQLVVIKKAYANDPITQILCNGYCFAWRDFSGSPAKWQPWRIAVIQDSTNNITVDTAIKTTANWAVVSKSGYYLINASAVRDDAQYYVTGVNKRSSGENYTLIIDQANTADMTIRLSWMKKQ